MLPLHAATVAALILAAVGGVVSLVIWRRSGSDWPADAVGPAERGKLFATLGLGGAAFFLMLILSQWIPAFIFNPCLRT
jgi:hypothetical protein